MSWSIDTEKYWRVYQAIVKTSHMSFFLAIWSICCRSVNWKMTTRNWEMTTNNSSLNFAQQDT